MRLLSVGLTLKVDSGFRHLSGLSRTSFSHRISRSQDITNDLPRSSDARNAGTGSAGIPAETMLDPIQNSKQSFRPGNAANAGSGYWPRLECSDEKRDAVDYEKRSGPLFNCKMQRCDPNDTPNPSIS